MSIRRLEKISYQEDQLKLGKDVYGIDAFSNLELSTPIERVRKSGNMLSFQLLKAQIV